MSNPLLLAVDPKVDSNNRGWVQLARTTEGVAKNGDKKFEITPEDLAAWAADIKANPDRIPIDFDHSYAEGGGTRAAGWVDASTASVIAAGQTNPIGESAATAELWSMADWTPQAAQDIRDGAYRYFSPEIAFKERDKKTGVLRKAAEFLAGALTNRPFFKNMAPVRLSEAHPIDPTEGDTMSKVIATSLGLAEDADEKTIAAAIKERDDKVAAAEKQATEAAEKLTATQKELDELKATASDADKKVAELSTTVAGLLKSRHEDRLKAVLDQAIKDTKMDPAERDEMVALAEVAGVDRVESLLKVRPARPLNGGKGSGGDAPGGGVELSTTIDGVDTPIDQESAELAAKVDAYIVGLKLGRPATVEEYLAAHDAVLASA